MQSNRVITFGEIMLRLATPKHLRFTQTTQFEASFGGGEANVAVSLANFGVPVEFVTRLPANDLATACEMEMRRYGVGLNHIIKSGKRIGIYFLETGAVNRPSKVIYDRAHSAMAEIQPDMIDWKAVFKNATWFHWTGITPALSQGAADTCMQAIKTAREMGGITVSCDLNYRKKLWKYGKDAQDIMPKMVAECDIVLGNEEDAEKSLGIAPSGVDIEKGHIDSSAYLSVSEQIMKQFPKVKKVITTLRGSISASHNTWSGLLYDGHKLFQTPTYQITHIVDRVGSGDSFMAGLIYGLLTYKNDTQQALNFAAAASCLKHTIHGDFNLVSVSEVEKLMKGNTSGRVSR